MKRNCLVLIFLFMLLLTASAFGVGGDVTIKINPSLGNMVYYGYENAYEIWIQNDLELLGFSLGFKFVSTVPGFSWKKPYGNMPLGPPTVKQVKEEGDSANVVGCWELTGVKFSHTISSLETLPYKYLLGGAATPYSPEGTPPSYGVPFPPHAISTLCYSMRLIMPAGSADCATTNETFTIYPYYFPPAGSWKLGNDVPTFNGNPVNIVVPPSPDSLGPPMVFGICTLPCAAPVFTPPVPGAAVNQSHGSPYTFDFNATEGGNSPPMDPVTFTVTSVPVGATIGLNDGILNVPKPSPAGCGTTAVTVTALNACPKTTDYPFTITWTNALPVITCPAPVIATLGSPYAKTFTATDADLGDAASLTWLATSGDANGLFGFVGNVFNYTPTATGTDHFTITATDVCSGVSAPCEFIVDVVAYDIVKIPKLGDNGEFVFQGTYTHVPVYLTGSALSLGGYNLLIYYDASALSFVSAEIGYPLRACGIGSGWEYFTYRFGGDGNCGGPCPSGLLRLVALAETNNGPNHPGCGPPGPYPYKDPYNLYDGFEVVDGDTIRGEIADLKFYVTNDRTFECQYTAIGFAWIDCGDNTFSDPTGNILYVAGPNAVHTFEWDPLTKGTDVNLIPCEPFPNMTGVIYGGFCTEDYRDCEADTAKPIEEVLYFWNGGIDIACANEIDARGDINLNGIANEIADAVLFTNFFLQGITAFYDVPYDAKKVQGKVAATDVNNDGHPLTVGDLVYLLRIIVGDAQPIMKLSPFASAATVNVANGSVTTESGSEIGAVYATFAINGAYSVSSNTNMQVESNEVSGELKVLVYSGMSNLSNRIASGTNELFTVSGDVELKSVEVADYYGNMLNTRINKISLPTSFALSQNVPNPFNPTTKLGFALPNQTEWTLSIYNVAGQLVKNFSGNNIGNVSVEWDASMAPSGVYFYKLNAGSYSDTKKMVLMK
jgi:hypothetical protein